VTTIRSPPGERSDTTHERARFSVIQTAELRAKDVMRAPVVTLSPDDSIQRALELFEESRIGGAPVLDAEERLVGVLTLSDVARTEHLRDDRIAVTRGDYEMAEPTGEERGDEIDPDEVFYLKEDYSSEILARELVANWMTRDVLCVDPEATLRQVCDVMLGQRIHRIFVTDERNRLIGVVTSFDVVRAVSGSEPAPQKHRAKRRPVKVAAAQRDLPRTSPAAASAIRERVRPRELELLLEQIASGSIFDVDELDERDVQLLRRAYGDDESLQALLDRLRGARDR
jgi:CBS domain-containing protein